jgi:type IV pilus assembly protein PilY1
VVANADNTLSVTVTPTYQAGGMKQNMGYAISGTAPGTEGVYLVAQDEAGAQNYFLNVPAGKTPGYCDVTTPPTGCSQLPTIGGAIPTFTFTAGTAGSAALLPDPLKIAAKWGGYKDKNGNNKPDGAAEWDLDGDGMPDNYFLVQNPYKLKESLKKAFEAVLATDSSASNVIANSTSVNSDSRVFQARFSSADWSGDLIAYPFSGGVISTTEEWNAKDKMFAPSLRKIYANGSAGAVEFKYSLLSGTDQTSLTSSDVVDYLRGDRTKELKDDGTGQFRKRNVNTVLGDIVHSSPFYESSSNVIYVGANDGMLHAFKGSDSGIAGAAGTEVFGFIPRQAMSKLKPLSDPSYEHTYFVDGDIVVSPATTANGNKNILAASLGRGGRGLFALDVTQPGQFDSSKFLWEYTPAGGKAAEGTAAATTDSDLGYVLGRPAYMRMNSGKQAIVFGNGYNSPDQKAVLYIMQLATNGSIDSIKKIDTGVAADNGLSSPTGFDQDNNGTIDVIYAGDLKGNIWKFKVDSNNPSDWVNAFGGSIPFFTAVDAGGTPQPITAPITVGVDKVSGDLNEGKRFVFFGTGSYFRSVDPYDTQTQSWYGLIDENAAITGRSELKQRSVSLVDTFAGKPVRSFSAATTDDMAYKKGWYLDFTTHVKERIITESLLLALAKPTLVVSTVIPDSSDPCIPGGSGFVNAIDPFTGGATSVGILDVNNNKDYADDLLGTEIIGSVDLGVGLPSRPTLIGDRLVIGGTSSEKDKRVSDLGVNLGSSGGSGGNPGPGGVLKGRISWREIILD